MHVDRGKISCKTQKLVPHKHFRDTVSTAISEFGTVTSIRYSDLNGYSNLRRRRIHNDVSFDKTWKAYKEGFGQICGDHWLGNENIHRITSNGRHELRMDIVLNNLPYHAVYSDFFIDNESHGYRLNFRKFVTGNMKDTLKFYNGQQFSTLDRDNDLAGSKHCARTLRSGWWYTRCLKNDTVGLFPKNYRGYEKLWESLIGDRFSLDSLEVKMRKV
ncbi:Ficolin-2 [Bulinus truncatus]|nr:Ficolin-2 [Bulinus truncatus]